MTAREFLSLFERKWGKLDLSDLNLASKMMDAYAAMRSYIDQFGHLPTEIEKMKREVEQAEFFAE